MGIGAFGKDRGGKGEGCDPKSCKSYVGRGAGKTIWAQHGTGKSNAEGYTQNGGRPMQKGAKGKGKGFTGHCCLCRAYRHRASDCFKPC